MGNATWVNIAELIWKNTGKCKFARRYKGVRKNARFTGLFASTVSDAFEHIVLCNPQNKQELNAAEKFYIRQLNTQAPYGYNLTDGGDANQNFSLETRIKMSQAKKDWWVRNDSSTVRANMGAASSERLARYRTPAHQRKAAAAAGRVSAETGQIQALGEQYGHINGVRAKDEGFGVFGMTHDQHQMAGRASGHTRWHVARGISNPKCLLCRKTQ
jgi:hypothetical protein